MPAFTLDHLPDHQLVADLAALVGTERTTTAAMLAHLAEVERRGLYLPAACSSMFVYATRVLGLSEDAALKRIRAARVARRFPAIFDAIADGRIHLSGVLLLARHFKDENVEEILAAAAHRTRAELDELVARLEPKPDLPTWIARIEPGQDGAGEQAPGRPSEEAGTRGVEPAPVPPVQAATRAKVLAPGRYALQVTIGQETQDKLARAQALLRHRNPSGDLAEVIDRALDALLETIEKAKFGRAARPRAAKARGEADARYVPREVRRAVHERDGEQCAFVSDEGVRCTERGFLELDHRTAVALGGQPTVDGIRILCRSHNQYEAERQLGAELVRAKRGRRWRPGDAAEAGRVDPPPTSETEGATPPGETEAVEVDREVTLATRGMAGVAGDTTRDMAESASAGAATFDERVRDALTSSSSRCSEGPFDEAPFRPTAALSTVRPAGAGRRAHPRQAAGAADPRPSS